ncbi:MAG: DUF2283 domain-containing protein [Deltaproteobacteria bacterium]|nr:DUF2283 domain-containing protein [Deltaproteobacteria bacterium]
MSKPKMTYFEENDTLHLIISEEDEAGSVELSPNITAELNDKGELIGIEILDASSFMRDSILETAQARVLNIPWSPNEPLQPEG